MDVERKGNGVAVLTLSNPPLNSFDEAQIASLERIVDQLGSDRDVRAVIVTGAGKAFSVGLDLGLLGRGFDDPTYFRTQLDRFGAALIAFEALPVPTIAAVNGTARAGGFELMLCCDLVLVASEARIGDTHLASGLPPGGGASARLPRRVGHQAARDLLLTGRWTTGDEAVTLGLALRAVPVSHVLDAAAALADHLASLSRPALSMTKQILARTEHVPLDEALRVELEMFTSFIRTEPTASEGYRSFVENREPRWT